MTRKLTFLILALFALISGPGWGQTSTVTITQAKLELSGAYTSNTEKEVDEQYAYIMPAGKEKPVKIGIEGGTLIDEFRLQDGSVEVQAQHMFDVAVVANNYWGIYKNTDLNPEISA